MGSRPDGWWRDRGGGFDRLLDEIVRWRAETEADVAVVADGHPTAKVPEGGWYGVEVRYAHSTARDAADDHIVEMVGRADDPTQVCVATSDGDLRRRVQQLGASVEGGRRFRERIADIPARRQDRAVLAELGTDESMLLGRGGEARVFALGDDRVVRLCHEGTPLDAITDRVRLLAAIRSSGSVPTPVVLDVREVEGRVVLVEERLPGIGGMDALRGLPPGSEERATLVRNHLDVTARIAGLPCPTPLFGEVFGRHAIRAATFEEWSCARIETSLRAAGPDFARVDADALTAEVVAALPRFDAASAPVLVHLDAFLGNMLAAGAEVTALLDFGPTTLGGVLDFDPLVAIAYLASEITPPADDNDRRVAEAWANERGLAGALAPVERWSAAYWSAAADDEALQRWCRRVLLDAGR